MEILENMEQWDTSEDIEKDLKPYLEYVFAKMDAKDTSVINELDTLKKILPRVETELKKLHEEFGDCVEQVEDAMRLLFLLPGHDNYKLKKLVNDQTGLTVRQKERILEAWEEASIYHYDCLPSKNLTPLEKRIRTKSEVIARFTVKSDEYRPRILALEILEHGTRASIDWFLMHPSFEKDKRASSTHQLKRRKSTKHKMVDKNITSSTHQLKRRKSTKHKRVDKNITSSTHQLKRLKSTSSPKASGQR